MKVGDLVRFKVHHYHKSYGVGVLLQEDPGDGSSRLSHRHWALFNNERIMVRISELEVISESR